MVNVKKPKEEGVGVQSIPVLTDGEFEQQLIALEEAMYALDGQQMIVILSELQKYQYYGTALKETLAPIQRKVEMTDYMSAVDAVSKLKEKLKHSQKGDGNSC